MLVPTRCPLGGAPERDVEVFPANFDSAALTSRVFSARRAPDRLHYRMVRNLDSGTLRADPILDEETLRGLYSSSEFSYEDLTPFARDTYRDYMSVVRPHLAQRGAALEIGCGNGFFLQTLLEEGFDRVHGVEPSAAARERASESIRASIVPGPLEPGLFPARMFSLICGFQVLDHLTRPNEVLSACRDLLLPGGIMYWICHDVGALTARLLGERCPMIDIEHAVLYDRRTLAALFRQNGFEPLQVFGVANSYPLRYWLQLVPAPPGIKRAMTALVDATGLGRVSLKLNLGNMGIVARSLDTPHRHESA